jgi:tetratricopeptide (TPR) repeat protein
MTRLGEQAQIAKVGIFAAAQMFALRWLCGGLEESAGELERLVEEQPASMIFRCLLALLELERGDAAQAHRWLEALGRDQFGALPRNEDWLLAVAVLIEVATGIEDGQSASVLYQLLEPYGDLAVVSPHQFCTGSAARSLGLVCTLVGRLDQAEKHFQDALAMNAAMAARPWLARAQEDYARMLLARNSPDDTTRARALIDTAASAYRELGMETYAARASSLAGGTAVQAS